MSIRRKKGAIRQELMIKIISKGGTIIEGWCSTYIPDHVFYDIPFTTEREVQELFKKAEQACRDNPWVYFHSPTIERYWKDVEKIYD